MKSSRDTSSKIVKSNNVSPTHRIRQVAPPLRQAQNTQRQSTQSQSFDNMLSLMNRIDSVLNPIVQTQRKASQFKSPSNTNLKQLASPVRQYHEGVPNMFTASKFGMKYMNTKILPKIDQI